MNIQNGKIEQIFNKSEYFDTKKILNRSDKKVNQNILNEIEQGITIEQLDKLTKSIPVFKYKTQITIHGIFDQLENNYINGYKYIFQNKNLSIGIKYNAIDNIKKNKIRKYAKFCKFSTYYNSTDNYIYKSSIIKDENDFKNKVIEFKKEHDKLDNKLFYGNKQIYTLNVPFYGLFLVYRIDINAIYEKNVNKFIEQITGKNINDLDFEIMLYETKKEQERQKWNIKYEKKQEQEKNQRLEKIENLKNEFKTISSYPLTGNYTLFYINRYSEKQLVYIYSYKNKRYIETQDKYEYDKKAFPRKRKNKITIEKFNKFCEKNVIFIQDNFVKF